MRTQRARHTRGRTRLLALLVVLGGLWSGAVMWVWTQTALVLSASVPVGLSLGGARSATWRMIGTGTWGDPARAYPAAFRGELPGGEAFIAAAVLLAAVVAGAVWRVARRFAGGARDRRWASSRLALRRRAIERGWVRPRIWARPDDLRRLWVSGTRLGPSVSGVDG